MAGINIKGEKELKENLKKLTDKQARSAYRTSARNAMKVVEDDATSRARAIDDPSSPTSIYENISMRASYSSRDEEITVRVGVEGGARYQRGDKRRGLTTYFRFVELGTQHSPPTPFLRPALQSNQREVLNAFIEELDKSIRRRIG